MARTGIPGYRPFEADKHPRGFHGRFSFGAGRSSNAHAMRDAGRPAPHPVKKLHALVPVLRRGPATGALRRPSGG